MNFSYRATELEAREKAIANFVQNETVSDDIMKQGQNFVDSESFKVFSFHEIVEGTQQIFCSQGAEDRILEDQT